MEGLTVLLVCATAFLVGLLLCQMVVVAFSWARRALSWRPRGPSINQTWRNQ